MTTTSSPERFSGRTIVVTGAGAGIGAATVERLIAEGARVVATDVVEERLAELSALYGTDQLVTVAGDIAEASTVAEILAAAGDTIDGLANVAGIMDGFLPAAEVDDETWDRVFAVNVTGVMRLTRAVLAPMVAAGKGAIVNVGSEAGLRGGCAGTAYTTSKHALVGFTKSVAAFYTPQGIRTNLVAPGGVTTSIEASFKSQFAAERLGPFFATVPAPAAASELAAAITWLLSDDSANISGATLTSDGGWAAA